MRVVIDIDENSYKATCSGLMLPPDVKNVVNAIKNGTVLPKGHGDLIYRNAAQMSAEKFHSLGDLHTAQWVVDNAPTVIPTDK